MFRMLAFAVTLLATTVAWGQTTYDPKIAYTQVSGKNQYVYLANDNGSHAWRVATATGNIVGVDFAPGGGRIAFSDSQGIKVVSYTAGSTGIQVNGVQLLVNVDGTVTAGPALSTANQTFKGIEDFDIAHASNALLITANYPTTIRLVEFNLVSGAVTDKGGPGTRGHFFADDSWIVYREQVKGGYFINSLDPDTGLSTRLTARGAYGFIDARP